MHRCLSRGLGAVCTAVNTYIAAASSIAKWATTTAADHALAASEHTKLVRAYAYNRRQRAPLPRQQLLPQCLVTRACAYITTKDV